MCLPRPLFPSFPFRTIALALWPGNTRHPKTCRRGVWLCAGPGKPSVGPCLLPVLLRRAPTVEGETLQEAAQQCAQNLPATTLYSFKPGWEACRVHEKWFMLMTEVPRHSRVRDAWVIAGQPVVIVKADPNDAATLRDAYADITAGYHMNKRHWITLAPGDSIDMKLVEELVTESYRLVLDTLPRSRRPIGSETVGS